MDDTHPMTNTESKARTKAAERHIRGIIKEWDPIPGSTADEYDDLVHRIISGLSNNADANALAALLNKELVDQYGIEETDAVVTKVVGNILKHWNSLQA